MSSQVAQPRPAREPQEPGASAHSNAQANALDREALVWALGALGQWFRIPFDPKLITGQLSPPYDVESVALAAGWIGLRAQWKTLPAAGLKNLTAPFIGVLAQGAHAPQRFVPDAAPGPDHRIDPATSSIDAWATSPRLAFVVSGAGALYGQINADRGLDLYDPENRTGSLTDKWIEDRAEMLEVLMKRNTQDTNFAPYPADKIYSDATRRIVLRPENSGMGNPIDSQSDVIDAGAGADHVMASWGDDRVQGGAGDDFIDGLAGNDVLDGGLGNDTCEWRKGDGFDTILDACEGGDGAKAGVIEFLGQSVAGTKAQLQPDNFNLCTNIKPGEPGNRKSHRSAPGTDARSETNDRKAA